MTIDDLIHSDVADEKKITEQYHPSGRVKENLKYLLELTDDIEKQTGLKLRSNSGYRCEKLNGLVGGAKTSYHLNGGAVDLDSDDNKKLWEHIITRKDFTEAIYYFDKDPVPEFIHLAKVYGNLCHSIKICYLDTTSGKAVRKYRGI